MVDYLTLFFEQILKNEVNEKEVEFQLMPLKKRFTQIKFDCC
jgi:hypothetical protein